MEYEINNQPRPSRGANYSQIHLNDYLDIIKKRKLLIICIFIAVVGLVSLYSLRSTPIYQATAQILIESKNAQILRYGDKDYWNNAAQIEYFQTQLNLLSSRRIAYEVIEFLDLWNIFQNNESEESEILKYSIKKVLKFSMNLVSMLKEKLGPQANKNSAVIDIPALLSTEAKPGDPIKSRMVNWYIANLQVTPIRGSNLCTISFTGTSPELITLIVNTHAQFFIFNDIQRRKSAAHTALNWIKTQLNEQKNKLEDTKQRIYDYNKEKGIPDMKSQDIASQKVMSSLTAYSVAKNDRLAKQVTWDSVKNLSVDDKRFFLIPEITQNRVIQDLRSQLMIAKTEQREKASLYTDKYPPDRELKAKIEQLEKEISLELQRIKEATKVDLDRAIAFEKSIQNNLQENNLVLKEFSEAASVSDVLQGQEKIEQDIYETLLKQSQEISLTGQLEGSNIQIIDKADVPLGPIKPRIFLNILIAILLSLVLGTVSAFFLEYMDNSVKTPGDVLQRVGLRILGTLPYSKSLKKNKTLSLSWDATTAKKFKRTAVSEVVNPSIWFDTKQWQTRDGTGRVIMIESTTVGEGKTTVGSYFARNLSSMGMRVLIADCDFQRPTLHRHFGVQNDGGLARALSRVLSNRISVGSLERFSVADIFFLIKLRKQSGQLSICNETETQTMTAYFHDGRFFHLQNHNGPPSNLLGNMLLTGGFITKNQLQDALERSKRTALPLGYILINAGYISHDKLKGILKLQTEESFQILFSWKKGRFIFHHGNLNAYERERIIFGGDYTSTIEDLSRLGGYSLLENEIVSNIVSGKNENLYVLPAGVVSSKPIGQMNISLLSKFFEIFKQRFDIIILDSPPLDTAAVNATIFHITDGVIFVIKAGDLSAKTINRHKDFIPEEKLIGAVLNQVKEKTISYY